MGRFASPVKIQACLGEKRLKVRNLHGQVCLSFNLVYLLHFPNNPTINGHWSSCCFRLPVCLHVCGLIFLLCVITSTEAPLHDHWEQSGSLCNAELVADYRSKLLIYASDQAFSIWRATACVLYCSQELVGHSACCCFNVQSSWNLVQEIKRRLRRCLRSHSAQSGIHCILQNISGAVSSQQNLSQTSG